MSELYRKATDDEAERWGLEMVPVSIDYEAIVRIVTSAVRLGNNMAAYNSGMGDDEIEAEGKDFADEIIAALGGDDGTTTG